MRIVVAADGSALGNPGPAGWAWYIDEDNWAAGGWSSSTNNRGELMAVIDFLEQSSHIPDLEIHFLCDSQYVINSVTKWMEGWKRRGWRKADKKPVLNADLMQRLDAALQGRPVSFEWVRGHAGHPLNEKVDDLARQAATSKQQGLAVKSGPGFSLPSPGSTSQPTSSHSLDSMQPPRESPNEPVTQNPLNLHSSQLRNTAATKSAGIQETLF